MNYFTNGAPYTDGSSKQHPACMSDGLYLLTPLESPAVTVSLRMHAAPNPDCNPHSDASRLPSLAAHNVDVATEMSLDLCLRGGVHSP